MNNSPLRCAIRRTLIYHSIFKYPLTLYEIRKYLIGHTELDFQTLEDCVRQDELITTLRSRFYLIDYDYADIETAYTNAWANIQQSQVVANKLTSRIPAIQLLAISGSTGALKSDEESDIDFFIITQENSYWLTRLMTLSYLKLSGNHVDTRLSKKENANKYCANYFIDKTHVSHKSNVCDLFTAMEIAHLKVIVNKQDTFQMYLKENLWIADYLPNFWKLSLQEWGIDTSVENVQTKTHKKNSILNRLSKSAQTFYYQFKNGEKLTQSPKWITDYRLNTLNEYNKRINQLNILP